MILNLQFSDKNRFFDTAKILPYDGTMRTTPKKAHEGQARAKFNFIAQTNLELSLVKGELKWNAEYCSHWFPTMKLCKHLHFTFAARRVLVDPQANW